MRIILSGLSITLTLSIILFSLCNKYVYGEKKVSVSEISIDSPILGLEWCGDNHDILLARTQKGSLYRSSNRGKNWRNITDLLSKLSKLYHGVSKKENYKRFSDIKSSNFGVNDIHIHPKNKNVVLVVGTKHTHFITTNAGESFRRIGHLGTIHTWIFHPTKSDYAILSSWTDGCNKHPNLNVKKSLNKFNDKCIHQLFVTKDSGSSFKKIADYVVQFHWDTKENTSFTDRVFFTHHRKKQGDQPRYGGWMKNIDFSYTDDYGYKITTPIKGGNKFLVSNNYIFVAQLDNHELQTVKLSVSTDDGITFNTVQLPHQLTEKSYTVLDTSENTVILHVNHGDDIVKNTGNIYISDKDGIRFALSLANNIRTKAGECEFDKIISIEGVYIANIKETFDHEINNQQDIDYNSDLKDLDEFLDEFEIDDEEVEEEEVAKIDSKTNIVAKSSKSEDVIKTVITFNKGGDWTYITAPSTDSKGNPINCEISSGCSLHLHGISNYNNYAPFYSVENAVGMILGTGNVGHSLRFEPDEVNTYMSRDGGHTWLEVHKGAFIYELGDHGGLIVMADDLKSTNQVIFSWNEGLSWYDFDLGVKSVKVDNILIEPNSKSMDFILYGTRNGQGVIYHLDFTALGQPQCVDSNSPGTSTSDYETWSPFDGKNTDNCILGRELVYTRKKQTSECYNGLDFERPIQKKICKCTEEDFICEFGFTRAIGSTECRPESLETVLNDPLVSKCTSSGVFYVNAYRKLPGDTCKGGWIPQKVAIPCPHNSPTALSAKILLFFVVLVVIILLKQGIFGDWNKFAENSIDTYLNVQYKVLGITKNKPFSLSSIISTINSWLLNDSKVIFTSENNKNNEYTRNFDNNAFNASFEDDNHEYNNSPNYFQDELYSTGFKNSLFANDDEDLEKDQTDYKWNNNNFAFDDKDVFDDNIDSKNLFSDIKYNNDIDIPRLQSPPGYKNKNNDSEIKEGIELL